MSAGTRNRRLSNEDGGETASSDRSAKAISVNGITLFETGLKQKRASSGSPRHAQYQSAPSHDGQAATCLQSACAGDQGIAE